ncbi:unnamed protein product [Trichobilharzia szidati]|nr:unnamed protein product [Trichobilharzia szidati]
MTQSIFIQVGQCGNQIGHRFWDLALKEHSSVNEKGLYDGAMSSFFLNGAGDDGGFLPKISGLKARALLVDMEEGVVSEMLKGPLKNLYDARYFITDVSGSGNNWAVGNLHYGHIHHDELADAIRKSAELCDYLQCFFILHSMGGGTGSGVGTHILKILADDYPDVYSSSRFEGTMNVDLNEISMNLVPFPRLHYLIAAQSPLNMTDRVSAPRKLDQIFADAFTKDYQLMSTDPCRHVYMAAALLVRGAINATDIRRNIEKLRSRLCFVPWNREGWKVGHCLVPPVNHVYSLLAISNNTSIHESFSLILERFYKLYRRKAHLHHYTSVDGFDASMFESSVNSLQDLVVQYVDFEKQARCQSSPDLPRLEIMD